MGDTFHIRVADLLVEVRPVFGLVRERCAGYVVDAGGAKPDLVVDLAREMAGPFAGRPPSPRFESTCLLRAVSDCVSLLGVVLVHSVAVEYGGAAYLFSAPSGTGKSTHAFLWQEFLGADRVRVLNGDKPLVRVPAEGRAIAYGTPWCGKEGLNVNASAPVAGLCFLERAEPGASRIERIGPEEALDRALCQVYLAREAEPAARALELLDALLARTPLWLLHADMSESAVRTSFEALTGERYDTARAAC